MRHFLYLAGFALFGALWLALAVDLLAWFFLPGYSPLLGRVLYDGGSPLQLGVIAYLVAAFICVHAED